MTSEVDALRAEVALLRAQLAAIEGSAVWRVLAPGRRFLARHPGLRLALHPAQVPAHLEARRFVRALLRHGSWDPAFYARQRPDLPPGTDLLRHYALHGRMEGVAPTPTFDPAWYAARHGIPVADAPAHYLAAGMRGPASARAALREAQAAALGQALPPGGTGSLAIGVVTFNNDPGTLRRMARGVDVSARAAGVVPRLLLLDNGGPASAALCGHPGPLILPSTGNVGFGAGHNRLMAAAFAEGAACYLALNPDAVPHPGMLDALLRTARAAGGRALVEALQFPAEHVKPYDPATLDTPWASGAGLLVPKAVWDTVGGFDEEFFMYCEDVDLSWRVRAAGLRVLTCPAALLFHPTTDRVLDRQVQERFLQSGLRLATKWGGAEFAAKTRALLHAHGFALPDLAGVQCVAGTDGIADFGHEYAFAPVRWAVA